MLLLPFRAEHTSPTDRPLYYMYPDNYPTSNDDADSQKLQNGPGLWILSTDNRTVWPSSTLQVAHGSFSVILTLTGARSAQRESGSRSMDR
ncbi:unnamed protein product, partial [Mycena citricolor]